MLKYLVAKGILAIAWWGASDYRKELERLRKNDFNAYIVRRAEIKSKIDRYIEKLNNDDEVVTEVYRMFGVIV